MMGRIETIVAIVWRQMAADGSRCQLLGKALKLPAPARSADNEPPRWLSMPVFALRDLQVDDGVVSLWPA